ncbi:MAG: O-antigen ligase family protein [Bacteroidetes bacterium]|nr:O-antigen ligase family protein [Bacteroidota bacterium]
MPSIEISGKQIKFWLGIFFFFASVAVSTIIGSGIPLLIVAIPLILFNRNYLIPLLLIIPIVEGALTTNTLVSTSNEAGVVQSSMAESIAIALLTPIIIFDLIQKAKKKVPFKLTLLFIWLVVIVGVGYLVLLMHPQIPTIATPAWVRVLLKSIKIFFFWLLLKWCINYQKSGLLTTLEFLKTLAPFILLIVATYIIANPGVGRFDMSVFGMAHHGIMGGNLSTMLPFVFITFFDRKKSVFLKVISFLAIVGTLYVVMQIGSKNGFLCFFLMVGLCAYLTLWNRSTDLKVAMVVLGILGTGIALYLLQDSATIQRALFQEEQGGLAGLSTGRTDFWYSGIEAIAHQPLLGFGGDETASVYAVTLYAPEVEGHIMHNTILEFMVEYGLLGFIFYFLFVWAVLYRGYQNFKYAMRTNQLILAVPTLAYYISQFAGLFTSRVWDSTLWYNSVLIFAISVLWETGKVKYFKVRQLPPHALQEPRLITLNR